MTSIEERLTILEKKVEEIIGEKKVRKKRDGPPTDYQNFMKEKMTELKRNGGIPQKEIMATAAKMWKDKKAKMMRSKYID